LLGDQDEVLLLCSALELRADAAGILTAHPICAANYHCFSLYYYFTWRQRIHHVSVEASRQGYSAGGSADPE